MPLRTRSLAVLAAVSALTLACARGDDAARRLIERGDAYQAAGRHDAAIIEYRNAIRKQSSSAEAYRKLADAYVDNGKAEEGYRAYCTAVDLNPADLHSRVEAGRLLLSAGRFNEALVRAVQTLERDEQNVDAQVLSGRALTRLARVDDAIAQLESAVAIDHRPSAYAALGDARLAAGDRDGAEAAFRASVSRAPQSVDARLALAQYLAATNRTGEAEQQLLQAVSANASSEAANRALASFYITTGRDRAAEPYLRTAAAQPNQTLKSSLALADYYAAAHRYDDARAVLDGLSSGPTATPAKVRRAAIELETGSAANARQIIDGVLKKRPSGEAWAIDAQLLVREGKPDEALTSARAAIDLDPTLASAHYVIGTIELERGRLSAAEAAFHQVLRQQRLTAPAKLQLARTKLAAGRPAEAIALAEAAGPDLGARLTLARALIADGQSGRARHELQRLEAGHAASPEPAILLGSLELGGGDVREARAHATRALAIAPHAVDALLLAARTALASHDLTAAEQYLVRAIAADPASFDGHAMLADLYVSRGDVERARTTLEPFAARKPESARAHTALGIVLEAAGRSADARAQYESALTIDPKEAVASNNLARLYAADDGTLDRAIELARTAVARLPNDADVRDTLGWTAFKAGRLSLAASELERAVALSPREPAYEGHLRTVKDAIAEEARLAAEARARSGRPSP
jgi:tetratricopeptide (TPR) repeat protein